MSALNKDSHEPSVQIEDTDKDVYSFRSASPGTDGASSYSPFMCDRRIDGCAVPVKGIDAEVAEFFADAEAVGKQGVPEIDDATNRRLRWMIHKRVLVVMVVTYFAQTLDKGCVTSPHRWA